MLMVPRSGSEFSMVTGMRSPSSDAKDDELTGALFTGDARGFDDEAFDTRRKEFGLNDFEHGRSASV
jgi:hypothetical protein